MARDTTGEINFFSTTTDGSPPWVDATPAFGHAATNLERTPVRVSIHDLRGKENSVNIDTNGFEILKYEGDVHDAFAAGSEMERRYYEDTVAVIKKRLGATRAIVGNYIYRERGPPRPADQCDQTHKNPFYMPHVDHTVPAAHFKVKELVGEEEGEKVIQKRFQLINVWKPMGPNPILNIPLAFCDYRSLDIDEDLHVLDSRGSQSSIMAFVLSHNPKDTQKWYYLSKMRSDEMFMFKTFDSSSDCAQHGPHTAFVDEQEPPTDTQQTSVEMRCLAIYD